MTPLDPLRSSSAQHCSAFSCTGNLCMPGSSMQTWDDLSCSPLFCHVDPARWPAPSGSAARLAARLCCWTHEGGALASANVRLGTATAGAPPLSRPHFDLPPAPRSSAASLFTSRPSAACSLSVSLMPTAFRKEPFCSLGKMPYWRKAACGKPVKAAASAMDGHGTDGGMEGNSEHRAQEDGRAAEAATEASSSSHPAGVGGLASSSGEGSSCVRASSGEAEREGREDMSGPASLDWREFRARLVASEGAGVRARPGDGGIGVSEKLSESAGNIAGLSLDDMWAHALYAPEKGCLLVASELLHGYNFFQRSVILLLGVGSGPSDGPYGIALNKPFPRKVSQVDSILPDLASAFGSCQVHVGGLVGPRTVLLVHGHAGLEGHCEVLPGVFVAGLNGLPAATRVVESRQGKPEDFQVVLGYAGWGEQQLRQEVAEGWWYVVACSRDVILEAQKCCVEGEGDRLWKLVLELMGGEYSKVAERFLEGES